MNADTGTAPRVLVVEDEEGLADLYAVWLSEYADVETVNDGEAALDAIDDSVDVVLLDRRMPGLSGDDVLATLRERSVDARVAIVSGVDPDVDIIDMGFDDYLTKPVSRDELRDTIDRLVTRSEYDDRLQALLAAISKRTALESEYGPTAVDDLDEYHRLNERIAELRDEADDLVTDFDESDFRVVFRDALPGETPDSIPVSDRSNTDWSPAQWQQL